MSTHALLNALKTKKPAFGAWLTAPGYFHARVVAQSSPHMSWIAVDCEHGLISLTPGAAESVAAITSVKGHSPSPLVRIPATGVSASTSWQIKYALDAGAKGVIVPMVSTVEKAKEVVSDCKFPPQGRRGFGSSYTHDMWGVTVPQYLSTANDEIVVMVQIETKEAVQNMKEIALVDGIDVLFIGPYDLSISLGYPTPSPDPHPEVEKVIQDVLNAAHAAGKKCAIYCTSGEQSAARASQGFDMINVTSDVGAMSQGIAESFSVAIKTSA